MIISHLSPPCTLPPPLCDSRNYTEVCLVAIETACGGGWGGAPLSGGRKRTKLHFIFFFLLVLPQEAEALAKKAQE